MLCCVMHCWCCLCCIQSSLAFSEEVTTSGEVQSLIKSLLTDPTERLSFNDLKIHPFFSSVNWEHLLSGMCSNMTTECTVLFYRNLDFRVLHVWLLRTYISLIASVPKFSPNSFTNWEARKNENVFSFFLTSQLNFSL